jgi:hypothetical protein
VQEEAMMRSLWTSLSAAVTRHPGRVVVAVGATVAALAEERHRGRDPRGAVSFGVPGIGRAFVASGLTLVGGS